MCAYVCCVSVRLLLLIAKDKRLCANSFRYAQRNAGLAYLLPPPCLHGHCRLLARRNTGYWEAAFCDVNVVVCCAA